MSKSSDIGRGQTGSHDQLGKQVKLEDRATQEQTSLKRREARRWKWKPPFYVVRAAYGTSSAVERSNIPVEDIKEAFAKVCVNRLLKVLCARGM